MPYSAEHKQATRGRIVDCARELFNLRGFTDVTVGEIMSSAGLTHGGFYNHFKSKDELYIEAVHANGKCDSIDCSSEGIELAEHVINTYMSKAHLENVGGHCPMIALPSDIARSGPDVRQAYESSLAKMISIFESLSQKKGTKESRQKAISIVAICVGGMVMARTVENIKSAHEIRKAALAAALELANQN